MHQSSREKNYYLKVTRCTSYGRSTLRNAQISTALATDVAMAASIKNIRD